MSIWELLLILSVMALVFCATYILGLVLGYIFAGPKRSAIRRGFAIESRESTVLKGLEKVQKSARKELKALRRK